MTEAESENLMTDFAEEHKEFYDFLMAHLKSDCKIMLAGYTPQIADATLSHWIDCIDPSTGHIEIGSQYTKSGRPVIDSFPEYIWPAETLD